MSKTDLVLKTELENFRKKNKVKLAYLQRKEDAFNDKIQANRDAIQRMRKSIQKGNGSGKGWP